MTELRPGDRVRVFGPGLEDFEWVERIGSREGVVTAPRDNDGMHLVVIYDERGDLIPVDNFGWSPDEFDDPQWPLNPWHRCVWLMLDGELELIEDSNNEEDAA